MGLSIREMFEWILHRTLLVIFTTAVITGFSCGCRDGILSAYFVRVPGKYKCPLKWD